MDAHDSFAPLQFASLLPVSSVLGFLQVPSITMDFATHALNRIAEGDTISGASAASLLGVIFHLTIRPVEFEFIMFHFMAAYVAAFIVLIVAVGFVKASLFASCFNVGTLSSIAVYRLLFHRCKKFPGPFGAKLSRFYAASLSAKDVKYYKELAKMHAQYGDFVRTGQRRRSHAKREGYIDYSQDRARSVSCVRKPFPCCMGPAQSV